MRPERKWRRRLGGGEKLWPWTAGRSTWWWHWGSSDSCCSRPGQLRTELELKSLDRQKERHPEPAPSQPPATHGGQDHETVEVDLAQENKNQSGINQDSAAKILLGLESVLSVYSVENVLSSQPCVVQRGLKNITRVISFSFLASS